ncbi:hypothetical protein SAMN05444409_3167 [Epilithonimonas zeae]|uniref:Uncharacterized protein n=1 Tax=Epilithonimonas zeae TaxID=1416779 RepID=A0A1N6J073_9FLAO|nr:hypothetical protein SAMN05444409_3167 [Epilithonimonas zeae]
MSDFININIGALIHQRVSEKNWKSQGFVIFSTVLRMRF